MREEMWRPITEPDFSDLYLVSNHGRVAKILRGSFNRPTGYVSIILARKGRAYRGYRTHQLVARAFLGEQPEGTVVNHKDGDKTNNTPDNLEFVSQGENVRHGILLGRRKMVKDVRNGRFAPVLTVDQVGEIKCLITCMVPLHLIADDYGVSTETIKRIKTGKNWNRVPAKD